MKKFLNHITIYTSLYIILILFILLQADGYTDPFYIRFTTPKQNSFVLGTSRAAQGIQPMVLNKILNRDDIFNYSFTIAHSPYGPMYFNSIIRKFDNKTADGIFIITVDPWSICSKTNNPNDTTIFRELENPILNARYVDLNPNITYLLENYSQSFLSILKRSDNSMFLHNDGWLEVNINMDSISVAKRTKRKIRSYKINELPVFSYSEKRFEYLIKTIDYLQKYGEVYLCRLPIHPSMMDIERSLMPEFNLKMKNISNKFGIEYFDLTYLNQELYYTDGNHLSKESGAKVSKIIANEICEN